MKNSPDGLNIGLAMIKQRSVDMEMKLKKLSYLKNLGEKKTGDKKQSR